MKSSLFVKKAASAIKRNSPTILSCIASLGVVATTVAAIKGTAKAKKIEQDCAETAEQKLKIVKYCWTCYIPTVALGAATVACIFGANSLSRKQQASLLSAYTLVNESYQQYKGKVKELYGEEAHKELVNLMIIENADKVSISCPGLVANSNLDFDPDEAEIVRTFYYPFSKRYHE